MSNPMQDLFGQSDELSRIADATELSAALDAYRFFEEQDGPSAALDKLRKVIQSRASRLCN